MIKIDSKENIDKYSGVIIVDITGINEQNVYCKLSPFYPHGGIPIPNTPNITLNSVNDVWQELCVKNSGNKISCTNVKFRKGIYINECWDYLEARKRILIPTYCWMLENKVYDIVLYLRKLMLDYEIVIVDRFINCNIENAEEPFSCAFLLKAYIEASWPYEEAIKDVVERQIVMQGRKEICLKHKKRIPNKISRIYVDSQRVLDF